MNNPFLEELARGGDLRAMQLHYAWACPNEEAIAVCRRWPLIEIGAGLGYWAATIEAAGGDVVAYDELAGLTNPFTDGGPPHYQFLRRGGVERIADHPNRTLLLCMPPYNMPMSHDALDAYGGRTLIHVGNPKHTGTSAFWRAITRDWREAEVVRLPDVARYPIDLTVYGR